MHTEHIVVILGGKMSNEKKQYENAVWSSLNRIKELEAENKELKERCERYIWNLGGVSTLLSGYSIDEFNKEYALPALIDTNEFVKKYQHLQAENKTIREQLIKELKEWIKENTYLDIRKSNNKEDYRYIKLDDLLAKLDLLEGKK
jgi:hypothetical protein